MPEANQTDTPADNAAVVAADIAVIMPPRELTRTYHYADGSTLEIQNVTKFKQQRNGSHRVVDSDEVVYVVRDQYCYVTILKNPAYAVAKKEADERAAQELARIANESPTPVTTGAVRAETQEPDYDPDERY